MHKISLYLITCLMAGCAMYLTPLNAQSQVPPGPVAPAPLTATEKRQILDQLRELEAARPTIKIYEEYIAREKDLDTKERANWKSALDIEKERTSLEKSRADIEASRAEFYQDLYNSAAKKKAGIGCIFKRIFTLGMARCP